MKTPKQKPSPKPRATKGSKPERRAVKATQRATGGAPRADFGAPIDGFFAKQPASNRPIVDALRGIIEKAAPDATSSIKWGMPVYAINGKMTCAIGAHRSHVNLILAGAPSAFADPEKLLTGSGKTGRHLKITRLGDLPKKAALGWVRTAAALARGESGARAKKTARTA